MSSQPAVSNEDDKRYRGVIDLSVSNNSHTQMYRLFHRHVGKRACRVLEVGCSGGYFGEALKRAGHEVWGIELNEQAAQEAAQVLDRVESMTVEGFLKNPEFQNEKFDAIVFGDVLEHLADPAQVLTTCSSALRDGGCILASVPNVAHEAVRLMLLEGRWDYADFGIMDNTHLRFFTRESLIELFNCAEYTVKEMGQVVLPNELTGIVVNPAIHKAARSLIRDPQAQVFQFTLLAEPRAKGAPVTPPEAVPTVDFTSGRRLVCVVPAVDWSVTQIRLFTPLSQYQAKNDIEVKFVSFGNFSNRELSWGDTFILQRDAGTGTLRMVDDLQRAGKTVIFDIDDLLTEIPPFLLTYQAMQKVRPRLIEILKMADAVTVSTPALAKEMRDYNSQVMVVPNSVAAAPTVTRHDKGRVTLILASSDTVRVDFMVHALSQVLQNPSLQVDLVAVGPPALALANAGIECARSYPCMSYDAFRSFLSETNNAVGLIPLEDSRFSGCKSAIKYLDYSVAGIPVIASKVAPYLGVIKDGVSGALCENETSVWVNAIENLATNHVLRERLSAGARDFTLNHRSLGNSMEAFDDVFAAARPGMGQRGSTRLLSLRHALGQGELRNKLLRTRRWLRPLFLLRAPGRAIEVIRTEGFAEFGRRVVRILRAS